MLETKANIEDVNESLNNKANKQSVANALHRKANLKLMPVTWIRSAIS